MNQLSPAKTHFLFLARKVNIRAGKGWMNGIVTWMVILSLISMPGNAQAGNITITANEAKPDFPDHVTFHIAAQADTDIDRVGLIYGINAETCLNSQARREMIFDPAPTVDLDWAWDLFRSGDLPPGVEVWWQWEIHAADGTQTVTDVQRLTIEDPNFHWQTITREQITIFWAEGSYSFGASLLEIAVTSLDRLAKTSGITPTGNIRLMIYPSPEDLIASLEHTTGWMGGVAFAEYRIVMITIAPASDMGWPKEVIPHELAHLVFNQRTANCLGGMAPPSWLNEGYATYAEGPVTETDREPVLAELEKGALQPFTSLANGFPADARRATLAYQQSKMMVAFLIETYGKDQFEALLDQFKNGEKVDDALRTIYGLDTAGLDQAWRASLGYGAAPEASFATPTPAPRATAIPTMALVSPFQQPASATPTTTPTALPSPTLKAVSQTPTATKTAAAEAQATTTPARPVFRLAGRPGCGSPG